MHRIRRKLLGLTLWSEYKKKQKGYSLCYMNNVEKIVRDYIHFTGIKYEIELLAGKNYNVYYFDSKYSLEVPKKFIKEAICDEVEFLEMATNIAHEFSHVYNEDSKYFGAQENGNLRKEYILMSVLKETRADIFSMNLVNNVYDGYSYNWLTGDKHYSKSAYFDKDTRLFIVLNYQEYNDFFIRELFNNIFEKDRYMKYDYYRDFIEKTYVKDTLKDKWYRNLICV